jgi:protein-S-isoprenylcysteine O-methyltransferase Ste14
MYVSYFLLFASLAPLSGNWAFSAFGELVILSLAIWRRPAEEAALRARFPGEYDAWVAATGSFIPRLATFADDQEE